MFLTSDVREERRMPPGHGMRPRDSPPPQNHLVRQRTCRLGFPAWRDSPHLR